MPAKNTSAETASAETASAKNRAAETVPAENRAAKTLAGGVLYVVATPIGNLADLSDRARQTLAAVDCVFAEDTRHTMLLCRHYGLQPVLKSLHEYNEQQRVADVLERLSNGESVALVSDAGTPLINDPGYRIVTACHEAGFSVSPLPGPSALVAALSISGLPTDRFTFHGFLPSKASARRQCLADLQYHQPTQVFFESCHRIVECLRDIADVLGSTREVCIARELTKKFEAVNKGAASDILQLTESSADRQKGEFVVLLAGAQARQDSFTPDSQQLLLDLADELPPRKATGIVARYTGLEKKFLYDWLLHNKN